MINKLSQKIKTINRRAAVAFGRDDISVNLKKFKQKIGSNVNHDRPKNFESKIEVLIPCYNHSEYLKEAFDSIKSQTYRGLIHVTFIDDNSTDDTEKIVKKIIANNSTKNIKVKFIRNSINLRQHGSLNKAIKASSNELFVILNDDDFLVSDCIQKIISVFKKYDDVFMVGGSSIWFQRNKPKHKIEKLDSIKIKLHEPIEALSYSGLNDLNMTHSSMAFFKQAWEAVGGYYSKNKRISLDANEDRDFQMRVNTLFKVAVMDYPLAYWRTDTSHGKNF